LQIIRFVWGETLKLNKVEARAKMRQTVLEEIENMSVARSIKESARLRLGDFELANFNIMMPKDDDLCVVSSENNENLEQTPVSR